MWDGFCRGRHRYALRVRTGLGRWEFVTEGVGKDGKGVEFSLGGAMGGGNAARAWPGLEEAIGQMEEGERSNYTFLAYTDRLPLNEAPLAGKVGVRVNVDLRAKARRAMLEAYPASRTLVLHHPDCQLHLTGDLHQEHPMRLEAILTLLQKARSSPRAHTHTHTQCPHTCDGRCARASL